MASEPYRFKAPYPDNIPFELTALLTLGEWRKILAALRKSGEHTHYGPLGVLNQAIESMVRQAEREWNPIRSEDGKIIP